MQQTFRPVTSVAGQRPREAILQLTLERQADRPRRDGSLEMEVTVSESSGVCIPMLMRYIDAMVEA